MIEKSLFSSMHTSAAGLSVQRTRMNVVSENLANVETTRTENGLPYRRKIVQVGHGSGEEKFTQVFTQNRIKMENTSPMHKPDVPFRQFDEPLPPDFGVRITQIAEDPSDFRRVFDPTHPDANSEGYVAYPNVNTVKEMMELITASRSYEANVTALNSAKEMIRNALKI